MSDEFDMSELEAFGLQISQVAKTYPLICEVHLKKIGSKFKKIVKQKSPDSGRDHKGKLNKSWKSKVDIDPMSMQVDIWSTSPHFHLVDRGHKIVDSKGKVKGFVQGKHFLEATAQEVDSEVVPVQMALFVAELKKEIES